LTQPQPVRRVIILVVGTADGEAGTGGCASGRGSLRGFFLKLLDLLFDPWLLNLELFLGGALASARFFLAHLPSRYQENAPTPSSTD